MNSKPIITKLDDVNTVTIVKGENFFRVDGEKVEFSPSIFYKVFNSMASAGAAGSTTGGSMGSSAFGMGAFGESVQKFVSFLESIRHNDPVVIDAIATTYWHSIKDELL